MYSDYQTHQTHQTHIMAAERQMMTFEQPTEMPFSEEELAATHWITVDFFAICCLRLWGWCRWRSHVSSK